MKKLSKLSLRGYKTIKTLDLDFDQLNVLIGPNGAGKSNFISFFRMLGWMLSSVGNLQEFIQKYGGANSLLHEGAGATQAIETHLTFTTTQGTNEYFFRLFYAAPDRLIFSEEKCRFSPRKLSGNANWTSLGSGHLEARLMSRDNKTSRFILGLLRRCAFFQFHNTSETARIRQYWPQDDCQYLKEDGANLASFLFRIKDQTPEHYRRIVYVIQDSYPLFNDFVLEPFNSHLMLKWKEKGSDYLFGPHQASDGLIRFMALAALLLQPEPDLPSAIIVDEPELGLHPYALNAVAGLFKKAALHSQVILSTQSPALVDCFAPEDIIVVDRNRHTRESTFHRLDSQQLKSWMEEYALSELWNKNVIGGRPA